MDNSICDAKICFIRTLFQEWLLLKWTRMIRLRASVCEVSDSSMHHILVQTGFANSLILQSVFRAYC